MNRNPVLLRPSPLARGPSHVTYAVYFAIASLLIGLAWSLWLASILNQLAAVARLKSCRLLAAEASARSRSVSGRQLIADPLDLRASV